MCELVPQKAPARDARGGGYARPRGQSFGTWSPPNWSGQISHGRLGVVPSPGLAAVARDFQMLLPGHARAHGAQRSPK